MRTFFGIILGFVIMLGGAYVYDSMNSGPAEKPMVNWDVVGRNTSNWMSRAQAIVSSLIGSKPSTTVPAPAPQLDKMEPPRPTPNPN